MMAAKHFILATAGHVDHGKSALVKALTGTDPDRLPEEKARGITIDLGFAHLDLPAPTNWLVTSPPTSPAARFTVGIIDVPGHEDFVKNMVAGVGSIDLALLVASADDGWMPQTEEHLQILTYLGVSCAVVALTKIDLAESCEDAVIRSIRDRLLGSPFAAAPIVATSVVTGRGLVELQSALADVLASRPERRDIGKPRLPVDRVFTLRGIGTVVTGTLSGGTLRRGQSVILQPSGRVARIRSLQSHNCDLALANPGTRVGLNLPDVPADAVRRGEVITLADLGSPTDTVDVLLEKFPSHLSSPPGKPAGALNCREPESSRVFAHSVAGRPLKSGTLVHIHHGSTCSPARVLLLDQAALGPGERELAQLRFVSKVFVFEGDRFIVRDSSQQATLAGGLVLDADASRHRWRSEAKGAFLARRAENPHNARVWVATQLARDRIVLRSALLTRSSFSTHEMAAALNRLAAANEAVLAGRFAADAAWWGQVRQSATHLIEAEHRTHPEKIGLSLSELRRALGPKVAVEGAFEALLEDMCRQDFFQVGNAIRHQAHRPALPPRLHAAGARLRAALAAAPYEPPVRKALVTDPAADEALRFLLETGEALAISDETVMLAEHFGRAREAIRQHLRQFGPATVGELRQMLSTSRRVMVPLLERLDREGVTLREGHRRFLREHLCPR